MTVTEHILTIAMVVLGTVTTRFLPFAIFPEGKKLPDAIVRLGRVLPAAVMGFLVIYCLKVLFDLPADLQPVPELLLNTASFL